MLPGVLVKRLDSVDILPKGIHRHKGGPWKGGEREEGLAVVSLLVPKSPRVMGFEAYLTTPGSKALP